MLILLSDSTRSRLVKVLPRVPILLVGLRIAELMTRNERRL